MRSGLQRRPPERARDRLARILVPGTTGALYTTWPGTFGFLAVVGVFLHAYAAGRPQDVPGIAGEVLLASVGLLGVHTYRASRADKYNAEAGVVPVPAEPEAPPAQPGGQTYYPTPGGTS